MADIDPALAVELAALEHQKPMNDVIDRGDSDVQQFYYGKTIFITGGFGFIGKQLIEKLLRACNIKKIYILGRSKKGKTVRQRLDHMLTNPVFDLLRKKQPYFADKLVPIEGNVEDIGLGLSERDRNIITEEVEIIFHGAATVSFDEPLRKATRTNVRGTRETIQLAKECRHLIKFVHISTAFTHATKDRTHKEILEQFYPCPIPPDIIIKLVEEVEEQRIDSITMQLIKGWPNTYTFTKAVAEELVRTTSDLPVCIVRPPIVIPSYCEPKPGWLDFSTLAGPSGIYLTIGLGILQVFCVDGTVNLAMTPIDYVNNAIIASAWDSSQRRGEGEEEIPIYTITKKERFLQWNFLGHNMRTKCINLSTPKAVWRCELLETKNKYLYTILAFLFHYIPAFLLDVACSILGRRPKDISSFVDVYRKIDKLADVYHYFLTNEWYFKDDNIQAMLKRLSPADKAIFNCDLMTIDLQEYVRIWAVGLRRFIIKDGLTGTEAANRKQVYFRYLNYFVVFLYMYVIWWIASSIFRCAANIFL
ncbi:fatty acyl-CoA reductase wat-like [Anticarsia gemmatalis]|uniref:fatty acyl-CoA reductase wat-like n=1 Tax=Anticarsia gemmatalis TaxID=129554 RepID=UPI003F75C510